MLRKLSLSLPASVYLFIMATATAHAQDTWTGKCVSTENPDVATFQGLECLIGNVLQVAITIIGLGGFLMFILGGLRYLVAGTDTKQTDKAKSGITYAVIGLVVALSSYMILRLIASFIGIDALLDFTIPDSSS